MHTLRGATLAFGVVCLLQLSNAGAAEPKVVITKAVFGKGRAAADCTKEVQSIITDRNAIITISTPGLNLKNPKGLRRDGLVIEFTVDGRPGSVTFESDMKVNLYAAILRAAPADSPAPVPSPVTAAPALPAGIKVTPPNAYNGKGYVIVPVRGIIGHHFTDAVLEQCLKAASKEGSNTIVLEIDSPGGLSSEMDKITKRLVDWQSVDGRVIALVKPRALSAAALIAISCREIVMAPASTIGATAEVGPKLDGTIKMKHESAVRASDRALAQFANHDPAIVEAMCEADCELWARRHNSGVTFLMVRFSQGENSAKPDPGDALVKGRGKVLTLTAQEALAYGLASSISGDVVRMGAHLKLENWSEAGDGAKKAADLHYRQADDAEKEIVRINDLVRKALSAPLAASNAGLSRQLADLRAAKGSMARFARIVEASPFYSAIIDSASIAEVNRALEARIVLVERALQ